jgi:predicted nucleic acid-binding protein
VTTTNNAVLVDTDVFSYLLNSEDKRAEVYKKHVHNKTVAISFVTVGEVLYGARKRKWGKKRIAALNARLKSVVIIPYDMDVCRVYAELKDQAKTSTGSDRVIGANDLWVAACARRHGLPLVSNNRRHFEALPGVDLRSEAPAVSKLQAQQELPLTDDK